ncbi:MAG: RNA polymerase sigma factor [Solirubrobacteraceae bacterium]
MAAIDDLPPDQRAVLQLLLKQGQSYAGIATLLGMDAEAVRSRAHAAVESLGAASGRQLSSDRRAAVADYLLGQLDEDAAKATRGRLGTSARARAWGRVVAGELRPLAGDDGLPEIPERTAGRTAVKAPVPAEPPPPKRPAKRPAKRPTARPPVDGEPAKADEAEPERPAKPATKRPTKRPAKRPPAPPPVDGEPAKAGVEEVERAEPEGEPARERPDVAAPVRPSSRLGGALLIGGLAILAVVLLIVLLTGGPDSDEPSTTSTAATAPATAPTEQPKVIAQINMRGQNKAVAVAQVLAQAGTRAIAIIGQGLQPSSDKAAYAVWLYNSPTDARRLGFAPPVGKNGRLEGVATLPKDSPRFRDLIVTRETSESAKRPGPLVLRGKLDVGSAGGASTKPPTSTQPGTSTKPPTSTQPGTTP